MYKRLSLVIMMFFFDLLQSQYVGISAKRVLKSSQGKFFKSKIRVYEDEVIKRVEDYKSNIVKKEESFFSLQNEYAQKAKDPSVHPDELENLKKLLDEKSKDLSIDQQKFFLLIEDIKPLMKKNIDDLLITESLSLFKKYEDFKSKSIVLNLDNNSVLFINPSLDKTEDEISILKRIEEAKNKSFSTREEIEQLFNVLGLEYLSKIKIDNSVQGNLIAKESQYYKEYALVCENNSTLYSQSIACYDRAPIRVAWVSKGIGWGVFADAFIKKNTFIQEYSGVLKALGDTGDKTYAWKYPIENDNNCLFVDSISQGNEMRFVNHNNNPNCTVIFVIGFDGLFHVCYIALRDIKKDEQLFVSYGSEYWKNRKGYEEIS